MAKNANENLKKGLGALRPVRLDQQSDWGLSQEDVEETLVGRRGTALLFGTFPPSRVLSDLEVRGALDILRGRGYEDFEFRSEGEDAFENRIRLYGMHPESDTPALLMDVRTHRGELEGRSICLDKDLHVRALIWEWLSFQDPLVCFPPGIEALPGQDHPGLGIFRISVDLMLDYVDEMDIDALVGLPQYFHNAVLYSSQFRFFKPELEGEFCGLRRDLLGEGLAQASRALAEGRVEESGRGRRVTWKAAEQVYPIRGDIQAHFQHPAYAVEVHRALRENRFRLLEG
jgi:hypothetical protein